MDKITVEIICAPGTKVYWLNLPPKSLRNRITPIIREATVHSVIIGKKYITYQTVTASKTEINLHEKDFGAKWFLAEQEAKAQVDRLWEEMVK